MLTAHRTELVKNVLIQALITGEKPELLHSDQGREYLAKEYTSLVESLKIQLSMSRKSSPWENGYQESFYSQFKVDLGEPNLGELVYEIYRTIYIYNHHRTHTKPKMPRPNSPRGTVKDRNLSALLAGILFTTCLKKMGA